MYLLIGYVIILKQQQYWYITTATKTLAVYNNTHLSKSIHWSQLRLVWSRLDLAGWSGYTPCFSPVSDKSTLAQRKLFSSNSRDARNNPQSVDKFQAPCWVMSANIPLAKESNISTLDMNRARKYVSMATVSMHGLSEE